MPVEIWSRFMRTALAGTAPTALPGIADGTWFNPPPAFAPPAPADAQSDSRRDNSGGLDSWLLDKLFGRR
jgi:penicillin-binding protein 1A